MTQITRQYVRGHQDTGSPVNKPESIDPSNPLVVKFTTPAAGKFNAGGRGGSIGVTRGGVAPATDLTMVISESPGDFAEVGKNHAGPAVTVSINFSDDPKRGYSLKPDTAYYVNIKTSAATELLVSLNGR